MIVDMEKSVVQIHFRCVDQAAPERILVAPLEQAPIKSAAQALFAHFSFREQRVDRAYQFVVMHSHDRRDAEFVADIENRRRDLMVDIVQVDNVGPLVE